jgi:hypothetical protein
VRVIALLGALALARRAGFTPKTHEFFAYHMHAHLDVFVNGRKIRVPPEIGIDIADRPCTASASLKARPATAGSTRPASTRASRRCRPTTRTDHPRLPAAPDPVGVSAVVRSIAGTVSRADAG